MGALITISRFVDGQNTLDIVQASIHHIVLAIGLRMVGGAMAKVCTRHVEEFILKMIEE